VHVLLVDDDLMVLAATKRALSRHGFSVAVAMGASEALRRARESAPQVVITDQWLEHGTGVDLIRSLRREECGARFILVTGDHGFVLPDDLQANVVLRSKPIHVDELVSVARQAQASSAAAGGSDTTP
jgi:two-component system chemotaxis response regulator CheY